MRTMVVCLTSCLIITGAAFGQAVVVGSAADQGEPEVSNWSLLAWSYAEENPGNEALVHFANAIEGLDTEVVLPHTDEFSDIMRHGWNGSHPAIVELLNSQRHALDEATLAAMADDIDFPPMESFNDPIPNFLQVQLLFKLLAVEARQLEAQGNPDAAAEKALVCARLANHMLCENTSLIQHLFGIAGLHIATKPLETILADPEISTEALAHVRSELLRIEQEQANIGAAFLSESEMQIAMIVSVSEQIHERMAALDPQMQASYEESLRQRAEGGQAQPSLLEALVAGALGEHVWENSDPNDPLGYMPPGLRPFIMAAVYNMEEFTAEHDRVWQPIIDNASLPRWERQENVDEIALSGTMNPIFTMTIPNFREAATRGDASLAHIRLCEALCDLRLGEGTTAVIDPMVGTSLHVSETQVWSVGPDEVDQSGSLVYDPTNGTVSPGDIAARR